jgi:hypothetical protein
VAESLGNKILSLEKKYEKKTNFLHLTASRSSILALTPPLSLGKQIDLSAFDVAIFVVPKLLVFFLL